MDEAVPEGPGPVPSPRPGVVVKSSGPETVPVGFPSSPPVPTVWAEEPSSSATGACRTSSTPVVLSSTGSGAALNGPEVFPSSAVRPTEPIPESSAT